MIRVVLDTNLIVSELQAPLHLTEKRSYKVTLNRSKAKALKNTAKLGRSDPGLRSVSASCVPDAVS
jgi:hypothetical protein